ncbi:MAG: SMC-Scp complex subunit ScpB [Verrucomicrobiales bacterium]|jgi:segregation and condensation protein B|nr:SMC-Scp complex subunit ScpB [Verrucomicrobiales bacterium]
MELKDTLEAILFSSQKPLSAKELQDILRQAGEEADGKEHAGAKTKGITAALEILVGEVEGLGRSYRLVCVAGAWQFVTQPAHAPWVRALVGVKNRPTRLSKPALETLAIIAYRQPLTRAQMEEIRGVSVDGVIGTLTDRELVEVTGRADAPGRPQTYGTTQLFLEYFGLRSLEELPDAEELRQVPITKPEAPVTTGDDDDAPEQMSLEEVTTTKDSDAGELAIEAAEAEAEEEDYDDDEFEDDDDEGEVVEEASQSS